MLLVGLVATVAAIAKFDTDASCAKGFFDYWSNTSGFSVTSQAAVAQVVVGIQAFFDLCCIIIIEREYV